MLSALQPGWLLLFFFALMLFLAGCAAFSLKPPPPIPTVQPRPTLVAVPFAANIDLHAPTPVAGGIAPQVFINTPPTTTDEPPGSARLRVEPPTCYSSPSGLICLGRVWNVTREDFRNLAISFETAAESIVRSAVGQQLVPAGGFAPYRVRVDASSTAEVTVTVTHGQPNDEQFALLDIMGHSGHMTRAGRFAVQATVKNNTNALIDEVRVVLTLFAEAEQGSSIVGYRIAETGQSLAPGAEQVLHIEIIPFILVDDPAYELHAEGRPRLNRDVAPPE